MATQSYRERMKAQRAAAGAKREAEQAEWHRARRGAATGFRSRRRDRLRARPFRRRRARAWITVLADHGAPLGVSIFRAFSSAIACSCADSRRQFGP
jgi:hypothetical protein